MQYYIVEKILPNYFNLLKAKPRLSSTSQNLILAICHLFPYNSTDTSEFRRYVNILRKHYSFCCILNNFFVQKKLLPVDPYAIKITATYNFPIFNTYQAKE